MEKKDKEILIKILNHAQNAVRYTSRYSTQQKLEEDSMCVEATVFNLMQIGELAKSSLSDEL